jgi:hypothetical protein
MRLEGVALYVGFDPGRLLEARRGTTATEAQD